jgi:hypothetical protein
MPTLKDSDFGSDAQLAQVKSGDVIRAPSNNLIVGRLVIRSEDQVGPMNPIEVSASRSSI